MVTIKDGLGTRQVTAEEAFLLYLRKKAVGGNETAQERLEEIQAFRREHDPDLGPEDITTIVRVIVSPNNPNPALLLLKTAVKLYRFQPHAQIDAHAPATSGSGDVVITAPADDWAQFLKPLPEPWYHEFYPASAHHGFRLGGDPDYLWPYYYAIRRSGEIMRSLATVEKE
jgi:hypothetical protein